MRIRSKIAKSSPLWRPATPSDLVADVQQVVQSIFLYCLLALAPIEQPLRSRSGRARDQTWTGECNSDARSRCCEQGQSCRAAPGTDASGVQMERIRRLLSHESRTLPASLNALAKSGMVLQLSSLANSSLYGSASMRRAIQPSFSRAWRRAASWLCRYPRISARGSLGLSTVRLSCESVSAVAAIRSAVGLSAPRGGRRPSAPALAATGFVLFTTVLAAIFLLILVEGGAGLCRMRSLTAVVPERRNLRPQILVDQFTGTALRRAFADLSA